MLIMPEQLQFADANRVLRAALNEEEFTQTKNTLVTVRFHRRVFIRDTISIRSGLCGVTIAQRVAAITCSAAHEHTRVERDRGLGRVKLKSFVENVRTVTSTAVPNPLKVFKNHLNIKLLFKPEMVKK